MLATGVPKLKTWLGTQRVKWPGSAGEIFEVFQGFHDLCNVGGIIGAVDGSCARIPLPADDENSYCKNVSIFDGSYASFNFRKVYIHWHESTHYSEVLHNSSSRWQREITTL